MTIIIGTAHTRTTAGKRSPDGRLEESQALWFIGCYN